MKYTPQTTLMLLIGISLGASIQAFTGRIAGWILLFLGLFLLVILAIQISETKKNENPLQNI